MPRCWSPRDALAGRLAELRVHTGARAVAVTCAPDRTTRPTEVNVGYPPVVTAYLSSSAIAKSVDYRRALSSASDPKFWEDIPAFGATDIVRNMLIPHGYCEGASVSIGRIAVLHISFESSVRDAHRQAVTDYAALCRGLVEDLLLADLITLSEREREVLNLIADGATNADIALELHIARRTVATHVEHILQKTDTRTRAHAAVTAARLGLL